MLRYSATVAREKSATLVHLEKRDRRAMLIYGEDRCVGVSLGRATTCTGIEHWARLALIYTGSMALMGLSPQRSVACRILKERMRILRFSKSAGR